jgi:hypothetical protein
MKTVHIMRGGNLADARAEARKLGITPGESVSVVTARSVFAGLLRGFSGEIIVHFDPASEIHDERDLRAFMEQVELAARDGLVIHHSGYAPRVTESEESVQARLRRRYFTAADGNPPTDKQREAVLLIQDAVIDLAVVIEEVSVAERHRDRALEDLEAVAMRAIRGIFAEGDR